MNFIPGSIYHVYNRGNNKQPIFFKNDNYHFFLKKIKREICPQADVIAYCLMPNHFHLMLIIKDIAINNKNILSRKIGTLLSSYTRAVQLQENFTGSLFQQKTKAIEISSIFENNDKTDYLTTCFHYIHQNPLRAHLVEKIEDWEYSSFNDYTTFRNDEIINKTLAKEIIEIDWDHFY